MGDSEETWSEPCAICSCSHAGYCSFLLNPFAYSTTAGASHNGSQVVVLVCYSPHGYRVLVA